MSQAEQNHSNDNTLISNKFQAESSPATALARVPDYAECGPAQKQKLDAIIAGIDSNDPEAAFHFGSTVQQHVSEASQAIIHAMQTEHGGVFRAPIRDALADMQALDLGGLMGSVGALVQKGSETVQNNKGLAAATGLSALTGLWTLAAAGAGAMMFRQSQIDKHHKTAQTPEAVEARIRAAATKANEHIEKLREANAHVPLLVSRITEMARANREAFTQATLHIVAGREIVRQAKEEAALLQEAVFANGDLDRQDELDRKEEFIRGMEHKLKVLELARANTVRGTQTLATMREGIEENALSLESLLTTEVPQMQTSIATAGLALDTYQTAKVTSDFRDFLEQQNQDAATAADLAHKAARDGRIDAPERVQKMVDSMNGFAKRIQEQGAQMDALERASQEKMRALEEATANLIGARADQAQKLLADRQKPDPKNTGLFYRPR